MDIYLIDEAEGTFHFPVNPEEISIRRDKQYETVNLLALGEVDVAQQEKVKEISFASFFPMRADPSYCRYMDIPDPQRAMNRLTTLMNDRRPVRLIVTGTAVNVLVYVASHTSTIRGGEPGDVSFEITLRTWRELKVSAAAAGAAPAQARADTKPVPKVYTVRPGDTLSAIAKRELGSSSRWADIYARNRNRIGRDPNVILPGTELILP